tara:strand:- start:257 stop:544 length:288 start_codon:yes stop_codon:yes gene_type:complete
MGLFFAPALILISVVPATYAAIFTVKPHTQFYSKPVKDQKYLLDLPEVRVHVPPLRDAQGFCQFKLIYKIADRENPNLPQSAWARCISADTFISN